MGDVYPITPVGKLIGALLIVIGIGLFALPAGILASGFVEEVQMEQKRAGIVCPHCGKHMDDPAGEIVEDAEMGQDESQ